VQLGRPEGGQPGATVQAETAEQRVQAEKGGHAAAAPREPRQLSETGLVSNQSERFDLLYIACVNKYF